MYAGKQQKNNLCISIIHQVNGRPTKTGKITILKSVAAQGILGVMEGYEDYDKSTFCVPRQYLPQSYG